MIQKCSKLSLLSILSLNGYVLQNDKIDMEIMHCSVANFGYYQFPERWELVTALLALYPESERLQALCSQYGTGKTILQSVATLPIIQRDRILSMLTESERALALNKVPTLKEQKRVGRVKIKFR